MRSVQGIEVVRTMDAFRWDEIHWNLWRVADRSDLQPVIDSARRVAREVVALRSTASSKSDCEWTAEKASILASLDSNGLTSILSSAYPSVCTPSALAVWELAWVDGGVATLSLSGSLAQMPIRDFGTVEQQGRYLNNADRRHGALCLTEPPPGAGTDAMFLTGRIHVVDGLQKSEPVLEIHKRGRFISHMDFADFVVVAVQGSGNSVWGSCLVILEPGDTGNFDRGIRVRKLGHQSASTTNPIFDLTVPASRIVGGYTMDDGVLVPNFDSRQLLEPAFRRTRAIMSLMTASKLLSTVTPFVQFYNQTINASEFWQPIVDVWAAGEAAASLGFSAVRISDEVDEQKNPPGNLLKEAAILSSAAKLFSSSSTTSMLQRAASFSECTQKLMDAQIESLYLGPEALQRRLLSVAMIDGEFLRTFQSWTEELEGLEQCLPLAGVHSLTAGMRFWHWTLLQLRQQMDLRGVRLFCDARQGVTFPMADGLCTLLAARSLTLDLLELKKSGRYTSATAPELSLFSDLSIVASIRAAGSVGQICAALLFGYDGRFPVSAATKSSFDELQTRTNRSLAGVMAARDRVVHFLRAQHAG